MKRYPLLVIQSISVSAFIVVALLLVLGGLAGAANDYTVSMSPRAIFNQPEWTSMFACFPVAPTLATILCLGISSVVILQGSNWALALTLIALTVILFREGGLLGSHLLLSDIR